AGENAMRFLHLAHRSAAAHKLHSTPQQDRMNLISGKGETSSRLPASFSLFLPGSCPNNRNRCSRSIFCSGLRPFANRQGDREGGGRGKSSSSPQKEYCRIVVSSPAGQCERHHT